MTHDRSWIASFPNKPAGAVTVLPIRYRCCEIPPALRGKKPADFDVSYEQGLADLLGSLGSQAFTYMHTST